MKTLRELQADVKQRIESLNIEVDVMIGFLNDIEDYYYLEKEVVSIERMPLRTKAQVLSCMAECDSLYKWIHGKKDVWCDEHD